MKVRLVFVDRGEYRHEEVDIPARALEEEEPLIEVLTLDPAVRERLYVDVARLCAAYVVEG